MTTTKNPTAHETAAAAAVQHLRDAEEALRAAYDHPHWQVPDGRLDNIGKQIAGLVSVIEAMPSQEESRADYATRVLEHYRAMKPLHDLPDSGKVLLQQEIDRIGG